MLLENMEKKFIGKKNKKDLSTSNFNEKYILDKNEENKEIVIVYEQIFKKRYYFYNNLNENFKIGEQVVIETSIGLTIGKVMKLENKNNIKLEENEEIKEKIRKATEKDIKNYNELKLDAIKAKYIFKNKVLKYKLKLKLASTEYTLDRKKLVFYFVSDERVDFRELVKELAMIFKIRIELRQIGVKDYAKLIGDCGTCGRTLCCKNTSYKFESISIKMARNQGVATSSSKLTGVCGKLKCCIKFENMQYEEVKENYPKVGQEVLTKDGKGTVVSLNMLNNFIFVSIYEKGISNYSLEEIEFEKLEYELTETHNLETCECSKSNN